MGGMVRGMAQDETKDMEINPSYSHMLTWFYSVCIFGCLSA